MNALGVDGDGRHLFEIAEDHHAAFVGLRLNQGDHVLDNRVDLSGLDVGLPVLTEREHV